VKYLTSILQSHPQAQANSGMTCVVPYSMKKQVAETLAYLSPFLMDRYLEFVMSNYIKYAKAASKMRDKLVILKLLSVMRFFVCSFNLIFFSLYLQGRVSNYISQILPLFLKVLLYI
jgi:hypothetical protein